MGHGNCFASVKPTNTKCTGLIKFTISKNKTMFDHQDKKKKVQVKLGQLVRVRLDHQKVSKFDCDLPPGADSIKICSCKTKLLN